MYANLANSSEGRRPPTVDDRVFRVFCYILKAVEVKRRYEEAPPDPLTPQEQRVYHFLSRGYSVEAIANRLGIKNRSVQNLIESIRGKRWIR